MKKKELEEKLELALKILEEQNKKIQELQQELSNYKSSSVRRIPISEINTEPELSEDTEAKIQKAVDLILKYSENIPYLQ